MILETPNIQADQQVKGFPNHGWWWVVPGSLLAGAFLYLYAAVLPVLVADWSDNPNNAHGFLVPIVSAYFVWERRQELVQTSRQSSWWGMAILVMGVGLLFLGSIGGVSFLMRFSMIVVITGLVVYLFGWNHLQVLSWPIGFLLFMVPVPAIILNMAAFPLQLLAAKLSTFALHLVNLPVYREGNVIFLPRITLEVVEACSGIRSLVSLAALAVVFAYLSQRRAWKRGVLVVSAVPIALAANAFRIWGTGVLIYLVGAKVAEGFYHTFEGYVVFGVALVLLFVEGFALSLWRDKPAKFGGMQP